jgi:hypothetical protein
MPLLETIEQRATAHGTAVDFRVQAARTYHHALARLLQREQFDRVIISATSKPRVGLSGPDLLWLLDHTQAEVIILRPAPQDTHMISTDNLKGPLLNHDHSFDLAAPPLNVSRGPAPD